MVKSKRPLVAIKNGCSCSMPGVWRAVAHSRGAAVIFHSPRACGHVTRDMGLSGHYRAVARREFVPHQYRAPLITSNLAEEHAIFGGTEQLQNCIEHVVGQYHPAYIVIANSCVAGVIGDDVQTVAQAAEKKWKLPVLSVPCCGFLDGGEYHAGFYYTGRELVQRFMTRQPRREGTVTLLGDRGGPNSFDVQELKRLLQCFNLEVRFQFPGYVSAEELGQIPSSAMNLLMGGRPESYSWLRKLAVDMEAKTNVPFLDRDHPAGWQDTRVWLRQLGEFLDREAEALLVEREQEQRLNRQLCQLRPALQNVRTVLCIGRSLLHFQPGWVLEMLELSGTALEGIILLSGLTETQRQEMRQALKQYTSRPVVEQQAGDELLEQAELVVTTHELENDGKRQLFLPILPPVGVGGIAAVLRKCARLATRCGQRGGIVYG